MRSAGILQHVSKDNHLITQAPEGFKPAGEEKAYCDGNAIGYVAEVFGPVKRPYLSILPNRGLKSAKLKGKEIMIQ